jgi:hypothetical protein
MKQFRYFSILALGAFAIAGCRNDGTITNAPPTTPTQVTYVKGTTYTYYEQKLDVNGNVVAGSGDTITSQVVATDATYQGKSNVTILANSHSNGSATDTTYISQANGEYWHYNYGLESANTNQAVLAYNNGKPIVTGWVLQGKFGASNGTVWQAANTSIAVGAISAALTDTANEVASEPIQVGSASVTVQHIQHHVVASNPFAGSVDGTVDTYLSTDYGVVKNVVHPALVALAGNNVTAEGKQTVLLRKN